MPHTPHGALPQCTHERGPGTTLCLHCRHEARLAARIKRQRLMLRGSAAAIVVATGLAASAFGASAMRGKNATHRVDSSSSPVAVATVAVSSPAATSPEVPPARVDSAVKPVALKAPVEPILPAGESALSDGVTASRADAIVTVSFDKPMIRTRIPDKFERFVRSTLPLIYGAGVDSALATLPIGAIAGQGYLLTELPARGIRIAVGSTWEVRVLPVIRPGVEGPLVVKYRTMVCAAGQLECGAR